MAQLRERPAAMTVTDAAVQRIAALMANAEDGTIGLRVGVKARGCSGLSYVVEYATEPKKFEEVIETSAGKVLIDPGAVMFLLGSEMDYEEDRFNSGFKFTNPNEKGRCGCGESFHV